MKAKKRQLAFLLALLLLIACGCCPQEDPNTALLLSTEGQQWYFGFGRQQIIPGEILNQPLYIAGYKNGVEFEGVLDYCEARALWLDTGTEGILLIGIDCVALDSGTVSQIRERLKDIPNCAAVNVYSTHTHAGPDTLGLWGPVGVNGKNQEYMNLLISAAVNAAHAAVSARHPGSMYYCLVETEDMCRDSRVPEVFDPNLYQIRLESHDGSAGLRLLFYGAHAESLRGANNLLSRDFPGLLCDQVSQATGDDTLFCPGAIGGLIMTREFVSDIDRHAVENLNITANKLTEYALSITPDREQPVSPTLRLSRSEFAVPMDNSTFLLYRFLGILQNNIVKAESATGYGVGTELSVMTLGNLTVALIPGEIFPELVLGGEYGIIHHDAVNPKPLVEIAAEAGLENLLIIGLANDEIGYIVPPTDFLVNKTAPYLEKTMDYKGENHYEETNSVGPLCADKIAAAFEAAVNALN